jgi:hypothetical protein
MKNVWKNNFKWHDIYHVDGYQYYVTNLTKKKKNN